MRIFMKDNITDTVEILKACGDETRFQIIKLLGRYKVLCVNAITNKLNVSQSSISQHLRVLRHVGLVNSQRNKSQIHYSLNKDKFSNFIEQLESIRDSDDDEHVSTEGC